MNFADFTSYTPDPTDYVSEPSGGSSVQGGDVWYPVIDSPGTSVSKKPVQPATTASTALAPRSVAFLGIPTWVWWAGAAFAALTIFTKRRRA